MSVLDYTKQLYLFSPLEYNIIKMFIAEYINTKSEMFKYLTKFDLNEVQIFWYKDSNDDNLGGFHSLSYDSQNKKYAIYINLFFDHNSYNSFDIMFLCFDTILHELKHYHQLKTYGWLLYMFLQLPIVRNYTIEKSAHDISNFVQKMNLSSKMILRQYIYLKAKYNVSDCYLNKEEQKIIETIKNKNVDIETIRHHQELFTYNLIELWLQNK